MAEQTPPRPATRRLPRDQRVATIMQTARAVLRERGSEQFLITEVAERCGISEATIYKYFMTKRDLLLQVAEAWFEEFLTEPPPSGGQRPFRDRLFHVVWNSLSLIRRERNLTRFVLMELRADPNYRSMRIYELNRRIAARVTEVIEDGVARGEVRAGIPVKLIRDLIFGGIEHQTWAYLRGEGDFSVEEAAEGITDVIFRGITVEPAAPPPAVPDAALDTALARLEKVTETLTDELKALSGNRPRRGR